MAKDKITDYDSVASNNLDVGGISVAEGMLPSGVNNAMRELMSHQKEAFGSGTPLYVDQTNNRVGIGTTGPNEKVTSSNGFLSIGAVSSLARDGAIVDYSGSTSRFIAGRAGGNYGQWEAYVAGASGVTKRYQIDYDGTTRFYAADGTTERLRILSTGGITFNGDTAAANALDDYEEGDYDCTVTPSTSGSVILNTFYNRASYTKVGRLVTVNGFLIVSSVSSPVGYFTINLPFAVASLTDRAGDSVANLVIQNVNSTNISNFVGGANEGASTLFVQLGDALQVQNDSAQELIANTYIQFSITYPTA